MKVSVVVPAFNQAAYLREALTSALQQTMADLEIVVVDDGSTDGTRAVCEALGDARLRYIHQPNDRTMGLGARNHAMLEARGEWIALLDQDDRWAPDKLEKQLHRADHQLEVGAVFCRARFIDAAGHATGEQQGELPEGDVFHALLWRNRYYAPTGMLRRALLPAIGLPHAWVGLGDHALWLAVARRTAVAVVDELLVDYRVHAQGYQEQQRRAGLMRLADDYWQLATAQASLLHRGCAECARAQRRARRNAAQHYLRALHAQWQDGGFAGGGVAFARAVSAAPGWFALPWVWPRQLARLGAAAWRGAVRSAGAAGPGRAT
ncbi:MAG TPA: glycosyltransferase [Rubrivivax sp.]|nr:glycosyltransferase [Rubrivivax sp.]HPO17624.1 glycosyltransferase [Rubrivivax sp.]